MITSDKQTARLKDLLAVKCGDRLSHYDLAKAIQNPLISHKHPITTQGFFLSENGMESAGYFSITHNKGLVNVGYTHTVAQAEPPTVVVSFVRGIEVIIFRYRLRRYREDLEGELKKEVFQELRDTVIPSMVPDTVKGIKEMKQTMLKREKKDTLLMELGRLNHVSSSSNQRFMPWSRIGEIEKQLPMEDESYSIYSIVKAFQVILKKDPPLRQIPEQVRFWECLSKFHPKLVGVN
jgi:hypothetical protein